MFSVLRTSKKSATCETVESKEEEGSLQGEQSYKTLCRSVSASSECGSATHLEPVLFDGLETLENASVSAVLRIAQDHDLTFRFLSVVCNDRRKAAWAQSRKGQLLAGSVSRFSDKGLRLDRNHYGKSFCLKCNLLPAGSCVLCLLLHKKMLCTHK